MVGAVECTISRKIPHKHRYPTTTASFSLYDHSMAGNKQHSAGTTAVVSLSISLRSMLDAQASASDQVPSRCSRLGPVEPPSCLMCYIFLKTRISAIITRERQFGRVGYGVRLRSTLASWKQHPAIPDGSFPPGFKSQSCHTISFCIYPGRQVQSVELQCPSKQIFPLGVS